MESSHWQDADRLDCGGNDGTHALGTGRVNEMGELPMDRPGCPSEKFTRTASAPRVAAVDHRYGLPPAAGSGL